MNNINRTVPSAKNSNAVHSNEIQSIVKESNSSFNSRISEIIDNIKSSKEFEDLEQPMLDIDSLGVVKTDERLKPVFANILERLSEFANEYTAKALWDNDGNGGNIELYIGWGGFYVVCPASLFIGNYEYKIGYGAYNDKCLGTSFNTDDLWDAAMQWLSEEWFDDDDYDSMIKQYANTHMKDAI